MLANSVVHHRLWYSLRDRGVYCLKRLRLNIADSLYLTAQEHSTLSDDDRQTGHAELMQGSTAKNYALEPDRHPRTDSRENSDEPERRDHIRKLDTKNSSKLLLDRRVITSNQYRAYSSYMNKYTGATSDSFERKFIMFKNHPQWISLSD